MNIKTEIAEKARGIDQGIKVIVFLIDDEDARDMQRLFDALHDSIKNGYWIIIDNAHLIENWNSEVLQLLYVSLNFEKLKIMRLFSF